MFHPSRGGVRGGQDQFTWDSVKEDKHRENYLGHSLKAPVGRWQKGKDLQWYSRDKKGADLRAEEVRKELKAIQEEEERLRQEALGLAPKRAAPRHSQLEKREMEELFKRGAANEVLADNYAERTKGLGGENGALPAARAEAPGSAQPRESAREKQPRQRSPSPEKEEELASDRKRKHSRSEDKEKRRAERKAEKRRQRSER